MWLRRLARLRDRLGRNPVAHWCLLFVVLAVTIDNYNNANPNSRYALMMAVAEDHSLALGPYWNSTCDWSRTPDGRYFSNKAPGPTLLALPLYLPVDALVVGAAKDRKERDARRLEARESILDYLSIALQAVPFAILVMVAAAMLAERGASRAAVELSAIAMLFGNTASLLMNTFFGHGVAAVLTLGLVLALLKQRMVLAGLLFGLGVLSDYGSALFFPILVLLALLPSQEDQRSGLRRLARFAAGGAGPLLVFAIYHALCFGGVFTLPNKFQNPVFVEKGSKALWGVIALVPDRHLTYELAFGPKRSLLVTQPWVLVLAGLLLVFVWKRRRWGHARWAAARTVLPLAFGGLLALFVMNASFGGWHGGVCPGPRYLSAILPVVGLALGLSYDTLPRWSRIGLWLAVLPSVVLFILVWAGNIDIWPHNEIWNTCRRAIFQVVKVSTMLRLAWLVVAFAICTGVALLRARWAKSAKLV